MPPKNMNYCFSVLCAARGFCIYA